MDITAGFTTITGETGAGKSIMLGALSLLLGKRADFGAIRDPEKKCVIEGTFDVSDYDLQALFEKEDLDYEGRTIIRREILPSGKSRAFVNDTPANLSSLQVLGDKLLDIHSQHETLSLGDSDYQFLVMDSLAGNGGRLREYRVELRKLKGLQSELEQLQASQAQATKEYDYNLFLLTELQQAKLDNCIQEELEARYEELNNVEQLTEQLGSAIHFIQQEEVGAVASLKEASHNLQRVADISSAYKALFERLRSTRIELDDLAAELEKSLEKIEANPQELSQVNDRLQLLYNLQKKHNVGTVEELRGIQVTLAEKVSISENAEADIEKAKSSIATQEGILKELAIQIHEMRLSVVPQFVGEAEAMLSELGMPNANLQIELEQQSEFNAHGLDKMNWLLSANKGGSFKDIRKAASGGEMSRIMLAVKSILASYSKLPTIIFDEIDTGVSGEVAQKMGGILKKMGSKMQVIAITHLPQIAGKGDAHFKIYKEDAAHSTITNIRILKGEARVEELAMMLGGKEFSDSAVAHAKALLN